MNKKSLVIVSVVVGVFLVGGGALAYTSDQNKKKDAENAAMMKKEADGTKMKLDEAVNKDKESTTMANDTTAPTKAGDAMMIKGSFSAYDAAKLANAEKGKVVLFFSASWCPTCREANKNFVASTPPKGLTLLKLDYDNSNDLKKKYGVTYQHTFVQVDKDGNLLKKWSGSTSYAQLETQLN